MIKHLKPREEKEVEFYLSLLPEEDRLIILNDSHRISFGTPLALKLHGASFGLVCAWCTCERQLFCRLGWHFGTAL
jgi:hypothetical protein